MGSSQGILPPDDVCIILNRNEAPVDLISMFVSLIQDPEKKLRNAKRYKCHKIVIDVILPFLFNF
jgi:hypothetical protein